MKRIFLYYIIMPAAVIVSSCSQEFLNLTPDSEANAEDFYETAEQFQQAVNGVYQTLRSTVNESGYLMGEMRSDNTHYDYYAPDRGIHIIRRENIDDFLDDSQNQWTNDYFNNCYIGVSRANTILDRIEEADFEQEAKDPIIGETKFLRAYYYFNLVRYFGDVPLYLNEVSEQAEAFLPRSSVDEVYAVIINDLEDAISKLPDPSFPQNGRANKGSASTLLAEVYMTRHDFAAAEPLLRSVTTMGYSLLSNYEDVYALGNKNSRESIFEIQFMQGDQGQQSMFTYWFIPKSTNVEVITGVTSNTLNYGGWNVPTGDMMDAYEEGDTRKGASIGIAQGVIGGDGNFNIESVESSEGYVQPPGKTAKPFVRKYLHPHNRERNTDDNWPVYRYSNVLLLLAECLNESGNPGEAIELVNQVRQRAGASLSPVTVTDQVALRDAIAHERRVELAFENHRWHDLVRTGKAIEVMNAHGEEMKDRYGFISRNAYQVNENRLIFPIPYLELQLNNLLTQNPGYN
ncbi:RagB/SusD family nutrient uptake outer membrane protein [Olivibacter sp. SDN3]|uniref:RagB/SusD family nutrient uptake outer membrane protein n=1 Tax=Olivibacter sp. SDN3 TaxID=2764720 RepID=UPI0016510ED1|nr:RagB/SusD family nutrient uptake outer membrane protein [Olivibacter sp. SDN3]QNL50477.1 RagB/SusD family nutrient uptake outer membrane protein [Olivibacter sp. SDN3]